MDRRAVRARAQREEERARRRAARSAASGERAADPEENTRLSAGDRDTALPKSPLGDAIGYALRQWNALTRYTDDGSLEIDNNGAENALRPLCLGRKNWLNFGSEAAAHRAMVLLTLVQTCKAHQVDPFQGTSATSSTG